MTYAREILFITNKGKVANEKLPSLGPLEEPFPHKKKCRMHACRMPRKLGSGGSGLVGCLLPVASCNNYIIQLVKEEEVTSL